MACTNKGFTDVTVTAYSSQGCTPPSNGYPPPEGNLPYVVQQQPQGGAPPHVLYNQNGEPVHIVTAQAGRETETPPDTAFPFVFAIVSIFLCLPGWPCALIAIIFTRKAKSQVERGQYTAATGFMRTCFTFIAVTVVLGTIGWIIFGVRLNAALDVSNIDDDNYR